jgi:outer membrane receptor protein involved in Fe transport
VGFEGRWMPIRELAFDITGDWQHADYTNYTSAAGSSSAAFSYTGKLLQRQPRVQFRFTPEYKFPSDWGAFRVFLTYTYVGLRYSDIGNTQPLPAYNTLDAGAVATLGKNFEIRLQASNLTNEIGLTEGNARVTNSGISNGFEMARPIFGREAQLQLIYKL